MRAKLKTATMVAALAAGLGVMALAAAPAQANAGESKRGCTPYWASTAGWDSCYRATVQVKLHVACDYEPDYNGLWKRVDGDVDPVDRHECTWKATNAWISVK